MADEGRAACACGEEVGGVEAGMGLVDRRPWGIDPGRRASVAVGEGGELLLTVVCEVLHGR